MHLAKSLKVRLWNFEAAARLRVRSGRQSVSLATETKNPALGRVLLSGNADSVVFIFVFMLVLVFVAATGMAVVIAAQVVADSATCRATQARTDGRAG